MNDSFFHETKLHGTPDFPYIVYHGKTPDFMDSFPLHWHEEAELIYIVNGQIKITIWAENYFAKEGDIIVLMPHMIHAMEQVSSCRAEYFNILFRFSLLDTKDDSTCYEKYLKPFLVREKTVPCFEKNGSKLNTLLKPLILSLIENRHSSYTSHELLVKANLFMIMHHLNQYCEDASRNNTTPQLAFSKLKKAFYHIQNSYSKPITIKEVASLCDFSESHFMKLFKELTGMSFTKYLVNYRLEIAAKQLLETKQSIIEISTNCGFNNHSYFARAFIRKYGIAPLKYRKLNAHSALNRL